jgi:hypothetical protein
LVLFTQVAGRAVLSLVLAGLAVLAGVEMAAMLAQMERLAEPILAGRAEAQGVAQMLLEQDKLVVPALLSFATQVYKKELVALLLHLVDTLTTRLQLQGLTQHEPLLQSC